VSVLPFVELPRTSYRPGPVPVADNSPTIDPAPSAGGIPSSGGQEASLPRSFHGERVATPSRRAEGPRRFERIDATRDVIVKPPDESVVEVMQATSRDADVVFLGLMARDDSEETACAERLGGLLEHLPTTVLVRNADPFVGKLLS